MVIILGLLLYAPQDFLLPIRTGFHLEGQRSQCPPAQLKKYNRIQNIIEFNAV